MLYIYFSLFLCIALSSWDRVNGDDNEEEHKGCFENGKAFHEDDCENEFSNEACEHTFTDSTNSKCTEDIWAEDALKCAKTCKLCCQRPEYDCKNQNDTFCYAHEDKCELKEWKELMEGHCPHTCGHCKGGPRCKDKDKKCKDFTGMCNDANPETKASFRKMCPETCGDCSTTDGGTAGGTVPRTADCKDEATNCDEQKDLCENKFYESLMKEDCKETCGHCIPTSYVCQDKNSADCARWGANGFCDNTGYPKKMRMEQCGKYCKMCT